MTGETFIVRVRGAGAGREFAVLEAGRFAGVRGSGAGAGVRRQWVGVGAGAGVRAARRFLIAARPGIAIMIRHHDLPLLAR
ncbi:hypothetical protein Nocox_08385 [Nonomuraea coxensis DSM 45129]|uniref:Uncharacterized protein n=1 Tax=Nonomuraea coxensis DSM 45129 TaxID=1122611 RepID=A0ABX8TX51_9ACTN|nr:hypothetical protein [Nonomuraea coxensis]QYC39301.1 hypothetical protein Nocox_08385 [Nonomuraea coxensis DSM 45129]